jgi:hypothetical protein
MRTPVLLLVSLVAVLFISISGSVLAGSSFGHSNTFTVDYNPVATISATPQTITAGESTYVRFYMHPGIDNCTANFPYTSISGSMVDQGNGYWSMDIAGGYLNDYPTATRAYTVTCRKFISQTQYQTTYATSTASVTVTVNPANQIDLTAASVSPSSATGGFQTTLSSTISNVGVAPTVAGFTSLFQLATDSSGTGATDLGTYVRSTALPASSNFVATLSHTFSPVSTVQTRYIRACADKSSSGNNGAITESNELNNCSPWAAITISPSGLQCSDTQDNDGDSSTDTADSDCSDGSDPTEGGNVTATLTSDPTSISVGDSSTLTWGSTGATSCTGTGFVTGGTRSGSVDVSPAVTSPYQVSCIGPGGTALDTETVTVGVPTADITVTPERVTSGGTATVTWTSTNAASCTVTGPGISTPTGIADSRPVTVTKQQRYTINCAGATDSAIVNIGPYFDEF